MRVIPPLTSVDNTTQGAALGVPYVVVSSNVAEPASSEAAWAAATSYVIGNVVIRATTHKKYKCAIAGVDSGLPESTPARWLDIGPTSAFAMFDLLRNTASSRAESITAVLQPSARVDSVALLGVVGSSISITVVAGDQTLYTWTESLQLRRTSSWYGYFYGVFSTRPNTLRVDLPPVFGATITVVISNPGLTAKCGAIVVGRSVNLGTTEYNAVSDALNFSKIDRDAQGNSLLTPSRSVPRTSQTLWTSKSMLNEMRDTREKLNAVPAVWSGLDGKVGEDYFDSMLVLGIYKQFKFDLSYVDNFKVSLEIEEI